MDFIPKAISNLEFSETISLIPREKFMPFSLHLFHVLGCKPPQRIFLAFMALKILAPCWEIVGKMQFVIKAGRI